MEQRILRRKTLQHIEDCDMGWGIRFNCSCHYDECLDYDWTKTKNKNIHGCICEILNSRMDWTKEDIRRRRLPFYKRILLKLFKPIFRNTYKII